MVCIQRALISTCALFALVGAACGDDTGGTGGQGAAGGAGGAGQGGGTAGAGGAGGGAGGEAPVLNDFGSGTRLKARYRDAGGGARVFVAFVDTALDDALCYPGYASDGSLRCVPYNNGYNAAINYYADAACSEPYLILSSSCPLPDYFSQLIPELVACTASSDLGSSGPHLVAARRLGTTVTPTADSFYSLIGESCELFEDGPIGGFTYYGNHAVVPESALAQMTETIVPADGGLSVAVYESTDGAFLISGPRDAATDDPCTLVAGSCAPAHQASNRYFFDGYFGDAACEGEALVAQSSRGCGDVTPDPEVAALFDVATFGTTLYELRAESTGTEFFRRSGPSCVPLGQEAAAMRFFSVGPEIAQGTFPSYEENQFGTGRLRTKVFSSPGGVPLQPAQSLYDTELDGPCRVERTTSGELRCTVGLMDDAPGFDFADAACTVPFLEHDAYGTLRFLGKYLSPGCDGVQNIATSVREIVPYTGPVYTAVNGCTEVGVRTGFAPGKEVGVDVFAVVDEVTDD
jgi:hypothetical protein